jgi:hypothetical protein
MTGPSLICGPPPISSGHGGYPPPPSRAIRGAHRSPVRRTAGTRARPLAAPDLRQERHGPCGRHGTLLSFRCRFHRAGVQRPKAGSTLPKPSPSPAGRGSPLGLQPSRSPRASAQTLGLHAGTARPKAAYAGWAAATREPASDAPLSSLLVRSAMAVPLRAAACRGVAQ